MQINSESDEEHQTEPDVIVNEIPSFNVTKTNVNEA